MNRKAKKNLKDHESRPYGGWFGNTLGKHAHLEWKKCQIFIGIGDSYMGYNVDISDSFFAKCGLNLGMTPLHSFHVWWRLRCSSYSPSKLSPTHLEKCSLASFSHQIKSTFLCRPALWGSNLDIPNPIFAKLGKESQLKTHCEFRISNSCMDHSPAPGNPKLHELPNSLFLQKVHGS